MKRLLRVLGALVLALACGHSTAFATVCDLTTNNATCTVNQAIFTELSPQPTGTGYIDSFLRLQSNGEESGYNTSAGSPYQFDQKDPINYTHDILLQDVPIVTINGVQYREFLLDINEAVNETKKLLSLDELRIFLSPTGMRTDYNDGADKFGSGSNTVNALYDLDSGSNNFISLNYALNSGSGSGDMVAYIPNSLFISDPNYNPMAFVYLYSKFGSQTGQKADGTSDAGFEEWWLRKAPASPPDVPMPEPASMLLLGTGLAAVVRRSWKARAGASQA